MSYIFSLNGSKGLLLFVNDNIIPAVMAEANKDEPPYDKNGKVIPFVGIRSVLLAMWIND